MPKFRVLVPEIHYQQYTVEAETPEEAVELVGSGEADYMDDHMEYSHVSDDDRQVVSVDGAYTVWVPCPYTNSN